MPTDDPLPLETLRLEELRQLETLAMQDTQWERMYSKLEAEVLAQIAKRREAEREVGRWTSRHFALSEKLQAAEAKRRSAEQQRDALLAQIATIMESLTNDTILSKW